MGKGSIKFYGDDPNPTRPSEGLRSPEEAEAATIRYRGLTVGAAAAVKLFDPNTGKESTRFALVFNAGTSSPAVILLPTDLDIRSVEPSLARLIADKVIEFPEFFEQAKAGRLPSRGSSDDIPIAEL
jgi:hypothetical protein